MKTALQVYCDGSGRWLAASITLVKGLNKDLRRKLARGDEITLNGKQFRRTDWQERQAIVRAIDNAFKSRIK